VRLHAKTHVQSLVRMRSLYGLVDGYDIIWKKDHGKTIIILEAKLEIHVFLLDAAVGTHREHEASVLVMIL
jgi:hypothetical protein